MQDSLSRVLVHIVLLREAGGTAKPAAADMLMSGMHMSVFDVFVRFEASDGLYFSTSRAAYPFFILDGLVLFFHIQSKVLDQVQVWALLDQVQVSALRSNG